MSNQESMITLKALNIVFKHWMKPSQQIRINALKKLQRFCRRGSGAHAHHSMVCNKAEFGEMFGPPVLYRQVCNCPEGECKSIPLRIYNRNKRMKYAIDKIYKNMVEGPIEDHIVDKYFISCEYCYCNNKPFSSYEWMVLQPRGNFTSKDGLRYIMCELSGDELTYYTRFKLSNYLRHRLS